MMCKPFLAHLTPSLLPGLEDDDEEDATEATDTEPNVAGPSDTDLCPAVPRSSLLSQLVLRSRGAWRSSHVTSWRELKMLLSPDEPSASLSLVGFVVIPKRGAEGAVAEDMARRAALLASK
jgi:hypothetical protein|eukprot:COSAG02_NODE_6690_length_3419_cov_2.998193_1_plen_121_part_00